MSDTEVGEGRPADGDMVYIRAWVLRAGDDEEGVLVDIPGRLQRYTAWVPWKCVKPDWEVDFLSARDAAFAEAIEAVEKFGDRGAIVALRSYIGVEHGLPS